ncbi:MAG: hypothetical protein IPJ34_22755 [Myxococcales bacterium]|nr:hypothetical protein [Myxococcales bacterium]
MPLVALGESRNAVSNTMAFLPARLGSGTSSAPSVVPQFSFTERSSLLTAILIALLPLVLVT